MQFQEKSLILPFLTFSLVTSLEGFTNSRLLWFNESPALYFPLNILPKSRISVALFGNKNALSLFLIPVKLPLTRTRTQRRSVVPRSSFIFYRASLVDVALRNGHTRGVPFVSSCPVPAGHSRTLTWTSRVILLRWSKSVRQYINQHNK